MDVVLGTVPLATPLIKLALRLVGLANLLDVVPFAGIILRAATLLFGSPIENAGKFLLDTVVGAAANAAMGMALSGLTVFVLGSGGAFSFAAKALLLVVKTAGGLVYLTVSLTTRGLLTAGAAAYKAASLPYTSPPPAHWEIQENYKPVKRESYSPATTKRLVASKPVMIDTQEVLKLAGAEPSTAASTFIECPDEQIAVLLGQSKLASSKRVDSHGLSLGNGTDAEDREESIEPPIPTVSSDALAGFLSQSIRKVQQEKETHPDSLKSNQDIEEMIMSDPTWIPPPQAPPGYAAQKLEESVDMHASRLRQRDPIVDSWMDVSAPLMDE